MSYEEQVEKIIWEAELIKRADTDAVTDVYEKELISRCGRIVDFVLDHSEKLKEESMSAEVVQNQSKTIAELQHQVANYKNAVESLKSTIVLQATKLAEKGLI